MARGGFERPPRWATVVIVVGALFLAGGLLYSSAHPPTDPVSAADIARERAASSAADASDAASQPKPALFLGDSYSAGTGASDHAHRFTTLVSQAENWVEENVAVGGTGYVNAPTGSDAKQACGLATCPNYGTVLASWKGSAPDFVLVAGGRNDIAALDRSTYPAAVAAFFQALRQRFPHATIMALTPLWDASALSPGVPTVVAAVQAGVQAVHGTYLDVGQPLLGHPELVAADGVHPNDAGHRAIAAAVISAIKAAGINRRS